MSRPSSLLSAEEILAIELFGPNPSPKEDLVLDGAAGLIFTIKGLQHYGFALHHHGSAHSIQALRTLVDIKSVSDEIRHSVRNAIRTEMAQQLEAGTLAPQDRELAYSKVFGTVDDQLAAMDRLLLCSAAGPGVIPVNFRQENAA